jgi:hypothetical protein
MSACESWTGCRPTPRASARAAERRRAQETPTRNQGAARRPAGAGRPLLTPIEPRRGRSPARVYDVAPLSWLRSFPSLRARSMRVR